MSSAVDRRIWDAQGVRGPSGIYLSGAPGRALPFLLHRAWKVANGLVTEEIRVIDPAGRTVHVWGPEARRMRGSMDLTIEDDVIEDAMFQTTGTHVLSFIVDDEIVGELEVPVYVQEAPTKLSKEIEDGLKKSDVIWLTEERDGKRRAAPAWFAYKNGRILVLSKREPGPEEQAVPGVPAAQQAEGRYQRPCAPRPRSDRPAGLGDVRDVVAEDTLGEDHAPATQSARARQGRWRYVYARGLRRRI